jgi:predicted ribosomally synthesized peptide with SipW-like signal peptide
MNTKILASLVLIGIAISGITMGTVAYFSDTETSTGNTFTAGKLDLKVDSTCKYNGLTVEDCTWSMMDIDGQSKLFFNFGDVKPGDYGEDTVSLHVYDNPACGFMHFVKTSDLDNTCTEPEGKDETPITPSCNADGELDEKIIFKTWLDIDCDNIQDANEPTLTEGTFDVNKYWAIGELAIGVPDTCVGISWKLPNGVNNIVQSDSFTGDLVFDAQQKRHQYATCPVGEVIRTESNMLNFGSTGWGGHSCPVGKQVIGGGTTCTQPLAISQPAKPGIGTYPVYPHYTYGTNEQGWVVQNGGTGQSCKIYALCV